METNDYMERYFYYGYLIAAGSFTTLDGELKDYKKLHVFCGKCYSKKNATCATSEILKLPPEFAETFSFAKIGAEFVPVFGKAKIVDGKLVQSVTDVKFLK